MRRCTSSSPTVRPRRSVLVDLESSASDCAAERRKALRRTCQSVALLEGNSARRSGITCHNPFAPGRADRLSPPRGNTSFYSRWADRFPRIFCGPPQIFGALPGRAPATSNRLYHITAAVRNLSGSIVFGPKLADRLIRDLDGASMPALTFLFGPALKERSLVALAAFADWLLAGRLAAWRAGSAAPWSVPCPGPSSSSSSLS